MEVSPVSFDDTKTAFSSKSDSDLRRAFLLFKMISYNWLVKMSPPLVSFALWAHLPVNGLIKATIFRHFCGGETIDDCQTTIESLGQYRIGTILDYSVEGKETEIDFEKTLQQTLATIKRAKGDERIPFCVFKPTGLARFELLEKKNNGEIFSENEKKEYAGYLERILKICTAGFENNVSVFIDAEESWIQDSIDEVAREMMMRFNKERVTVYNTLQMYRNDRLEYFRKSLLHAAENNYLAGFKIVRGAYMEKERAHAIKANRPSPVHSDKFSTDNDYNAALKFAIDNIDRISFCCATHNEQSCHKLITWMNEKKLSPSHPHIYFSQLYGMSDHISYNLAGKGYNVSKYVPFGPVRDVLPYLIRRAQENTSVSGQTGRELSLLMIEKERRRQK